MLLGGGSAHNCYTRKQGGEIFTHYPELHLAQEVTYKTISAREPTHSPFPSY